MVDRKYKVLIHLETVKKAKAYLEGLQFKSVLAGVRLSSRLEIENLADLSSERFIEILLNTKYPQIFAESAVYGDGSDWSHVELSILGDLAISVPVIIYDNGLHNAPDIYTAPFDGTLVYVPGALLRNGKSVVPVDWMEVTQNDQISKSGFGSLYERRLLPVFKYIDMMAKKNGTKALVTIPGIGCGQFAGRFRGEMGSHFEHTLIPFLEKYAKDLLNIKVIYYDPYSECENRRYEIEHISLLVRPLQKANQNRPQLCKPDVYEDVGDDFKDLELFSIVAWDHVSWPGNDFYLGSRVTDDGVKAAATNSMAVMTGVQGVYNDMTNAYEPPRQYRNWKEVVEQNRLEIKIKDGLHIVS